jgi:hypothetical protein
MQEAKSFECRCGLVTSPAGRGIFIQSPRTGKRVEIFNAAFCLLPDRLPGRIAQAVARGVQAVSFTRDELKAVADVHTLLHPVVVEAKPNPSREWYRPTRRFNRSFSRRR